MAAPAPRAGKWKSVIKIRDKGKSKASEAPAKNERQGQRMKQ
jgi:hypothetical protein